MLSHLPEFPEDDGENDHRHQRLDDGPRRPEYGLFVADLDVTPGKEEEQIAVVPDLR